MKIFYRTLRQLELALLVCLFALLLILGLAQFGLRHIAADPVAWIGPALNTLLLWTTMIGAIMGAGELRHFRIDAVERCLPEPVRTLIRRLVLALTALTAFYLAWLAWHWIRFEMALQDTAFLAVPEGAARLIVPLAFVLIGSRFLSIAIWWPAAARRRMA